MNAVIFILETGEFSMKLRVRHNSLRLRLTRREVDQLIETGLVEETVEFTPRPLVYMLHASQACSEIQASFVNGWITVSVPGAMAKDWASSEQVGLQATHRDVAILIEKDWSCLHAASENNGSDENEDTFPHP